MKTNPSDLPAKLAQHREAEQWLRDYAREHYPRGTVVRVECERYTGVGIASSYEDSMKVLWVRLQNRSVCDYPLDQIRPITAEERASLPEWVLRVEKEVK